MMMILVFMLLAVPGVDPRCGTQVRQCTCPQDNYVRCSDAMLTRIPTFYLPTPFVGFVFHRNYIMSLTDADLRRLGPGARVLDLRFQNTVECVKNFLSAPTSVRILGLCEVTIYLFIFFLHYILAFCVPVVIIG